MHVRKHLTAAAAVLAAVWIGVAATSAGAAPSALHLLYSGLAAGSGSTVGPDGALYANDPINGTIVRVDPSTGRASTYADCLPKRLVPMFGFSGGMDVAFVGNTAYALVTDGHHNRVLRVGLDGSVSELKGFGDVVPTGLAVHGNTIYIAEAGPIVGGSEIGKVVSIDANSGTVADVAASAPLMVDVEPGRGQTLFGLAQGTHSVGDPGSPADPNTGELLRVDGQGGFSVVATGLDRPTSLEIIGNTAYVVTLTGQIWVVDDIAAPPYGA